MVEWTYTLDISDIWQAAEGREITPQETAKRIADRLSSLKVTPDLDDSKEEVIDTFQDVAENPNASFEDFDFAMEALYDWGDLTMIPGWRGRRLCWINRICPKVTGEKP